jgi:hypothetical protein
MLLIKYRFFYHHMAIFIGFFVFDVIVVVFLLC